jgi:hypothetical protein
MEERAKILFRLIAPGNLTITKRKVDIEKTNIRKELICKFLKIINGIIF